MFGFQAAGAAPIVDGHPIENPNTVATAIRIGNPASWLGATRALQESKGHIDKVTDDEILERLQIDCAHGGDFCRTRVCRAIGGTYQVH